jgi:hypothetical protein
MFVDNATPPGTPPSASQVSETAFSDYLKNFSKKLEESLSSVVKGVVDGDVAYLLDEVKRLDVEASKVTASFGQGRENIQNIKAAMADASASVLALGGSYEQITAIQVDASNALKRNVVLGSEVYDDIFAASQVTKTSTADMVSKFKDVGVSVYGVSDGMQKIVDTARAQGLSVQAVSKQAMDNMESMNKYNFQGGVEGLAKMASQATSLRIDMSKTLSFAEGLYNPEKAIEMSSALQRLGVTQSELLDPLRLMDLSMNDPTELQNQLVKMTEQFVQLNEKGQFEIAPQGKLQLREISDATKIPYEQLTKMAMGSAELEEKMRKIRFPDFMSAEQQKMVANLAEMKDGQYVITVDGQTKPIAEALEGINNQQQLDELIGKTEPKKMEDIAFEQLNIQKQMEASLKSLEGRAARGIASSKAVDRFMKAGSEGLRTSTGILTDEGALGPKVFRDFADVTVGGQVESILSKLFAGNYNLGEEFTQIGTDLEEIVNKQSEVLGKNLEKSAPEYEKILNYLPKPLADEIKNAISSNKAEPGTQKVNRTETGEEAPSGTTPKADATVQGGESKMDININVTAPPGMSQQQIMDALNIQEIKEKIYKIYEDMSKDFKKKS